MKRNQISALLCGLSLLFSSQLLLADHADTQTSEQGIAYMTGGIGADEKELLQSHSNAFSLRLLFAEGPCGRAATGVNVNIYDKRKALVFQLDNAEPTLLVNLPAGQYKVTADYQGVSQGHTFTLKANDHKKLVLNWQGCSDEDALSSD
ncbi:MAG TPA: hypothetical protein VGD04_04960 [Methylophilus sp.]